MYNCERTCERINIKIEFDDIFKKCDKKCLFDEIIATLEKEYVNDII